MNESELIQIKKFIMDGCEINHFFAHRVWFNLKASLVNKENHTDALKILEFLSELEVYIQKNSEKLYIAKSDALIKLIRKSNLSQLLEQECHDQYLKDEKIFKDQKDAVDS